MSEKKEKSSGKRFKWVPEDFLKDFYIEPHNLFGLKTLIMVKKEMNN